MTHEHITVMKQCIYLQMTSFFFMLSSRKNQNFQRILRYIEGRYSYKKLKCIQLETIVLSQKKVETNQDQYLKEVVKFFQLLYVSIWKSSVSSAALRGEILGIFVDSIHYCLVQVNRAEQTLIKILQNNQCVSETETAAFL